VELEPESLDSSVPSSSTVSDTRPDTPETARPESPHITTTTQSTSATRTMKQHYTNGPDQIIPSELLKTTEPDGAVKLKIGRGPSAYTPISVPSLLKKAVDQFPNNYALAQKKEKDGPWQYFTYMQYYDQVKTVAKAFIKLGLEPYHGVCILGFNSPEWFFADLGAVFAGGFAAGIYTTNSPEACQHCAANCEAQIWVVEDEKQLAKVLQIKDNLPTTKAIIQWSGKVTTEGVLSWEELIHLGRQQPDTDLEQRLSGIAINQCCTLIYTSGTTGPPKGVMLSHDNITWTTHNFSVEIKTNPGQEVMISYLPLSHIAAQLADIYTIMYSGGLVYFAGADALKGSLGATLKECRPTRFLGVPRVWEKIYEKMMEMGKKTTGVKKSISTWAKGVGTESNLRKERGDFSKPLGYSVANAVVFKKVKLALGLDRCESLFTGAAPIAPEIVKYFHSLDILIVDIYGMSETSGPHNVGMNHAFRYGSVGKTINGCHTKLLNPDDEGNGEICMGGRHISMGYLRMQEKTDEAIDDEGWCHSGDIGREDKDGYLFITGRIKELIITAGGENIPPVLIEDSLKENLPCISNCMLIGDKRKFLSILLTFKVEIDLETGWPTDQLTPACVEWCRSVGSSANTIHDVLSGPDAKIMRAIQEGIDNTNKRATSNAQKIAKWTILPKDFSIPGDELGPTMKLKRPVVNKKYAQSIERFYENL